MSKKIEMQVDWHPSGNRTLKERESGQSIWKDVQDSKLAVNSNDAEFYRAVVQRVQEPLDNGDLVINLRDSSS